MTDTDPLPQEPDGPADSPTQAPANPQQNSRRVVKAVGPKLRVLLTIVFALTALLGANSAYLASITALEFVTGDLFQDSFYQWMFLGHLLIGLLLIVPFVVFGIIHMLNTRHRKNRRAVRVGYALFAICITVLLTGLTLVRIEGLFDLKAPLARSTVYWLHVACPVFAGWLYWLHRLVGPKIRWKVAKIYGGAVAALVVLMVVMHSQDPRTWNAEAPKQGEKYFHPSLARTTTGNFIPAKVLMNDEYCVKCHADIHADWKDSVHHFSSFNNPTYLASVRATREKVLKRDGNVQASRWCAGCHDPVPFFSGAFDDPAFDDVKHATAHAGITCTVCHSIVDTPEHGPIGNADYLIEEPIHYPFTSSKSEFLQWVNGQLIKAKPAFHKQTFLKPLHKSAEFCATCHKVHLPRELNHYKEFLRGQNHYDSYHLSGVSGHGARSFYYPPHAKQNCSVCHMPLKESGDFGARLFDDSGKLTIHDHLFPAANTAIAYLRNKPDIVERHLNFAKSATRVDIFGVRDGPDFDDPLFAPLRPTVPTLKPGNSYVIEAVIRTLAIGHHFTQGTVDSNQVWLDVTVKAGDQIIGRSGAMDDDKRVDPWSHFVNVFMLDKDGNRIDRRNPEDIVVPLYNHQIPPGAGQTVHYGIVLPEDLNQHITIEVKLQYRKFNSVFMDFVTRTAKDGDIPIRGHERGKPYRNELPVRTMAVDRITLPVEGVTGDIQDPVRDIPEWQRWNDYGIGLLLRGTLQLKQAEHAFQQVEKSGRYDGPLNLARLYEKEGRLADTESEDNAVKALTRATQHTDPAPPPWTWNWLSGVVNKQQNRLEEAEQNFRKVLEDDTAEHRERGFDFSQDYVVRNLLGETLFDQAKRLRVAANAAQRNALLKKAADEFQKTLKLDSENLTAHYQLSQIYRALDNNDLAETHRKMHERLRPDNHARGEAIRLAKEKYPAANKAAEEIVIYDLQRKPE